MKQFLVIAFCLVMFSCKGQKVISVPPDTTTIAVTIPIQDNSGKLLINGFARIPSMSNTVTIPAIRLPVIPPIIIRDTSLPKGTYLQIRIEGAGGTTARIYNLLVDTVIGNVHYTKPK